jgi:hypothetical protein
MKSAGWVAVVVACAAACSSTGAGLADSEGGPGSGGGGSLGGIVSDSDAGTGRAPVEPDAACLTNTNSARAKPANLLFQIDVSGSMNCAATDSASAACAASASSRWSVFRAKLKATLATLPDANAVGLMHYPSGKGTFSGQPTACVPQAPDVAVGPLGATRAAIGASLDARIPEGGTPTHDAVRAALAQLDRVPAANGNRFLVLATDGNATFCRGCDISCDSAALARDSDAMVAAVAAAATQGIRTFVIGVPGSQGFRSILSRVAEAGGTSLGAGCSHTGPTYCHYDMTTAPDFGAALQSALAAIGGAALSCTYDVPPSDGTFDPNLVNVQLKSGSTSRDVPRDPARRDGWDYSDDGRQINLYGASCDAAKSATDGAVTILYGCPSVLR